MQKRILELCCFNLAAAQLAAEWNVSRIELCTNRELGGTTPAVSELKKALSMGLLVYPIIRPHGGDFCYSNSDFTLLLEQLNKAIRLGVKGIVSGVITPDKKIDEARTLELVNNCKGLDFTFHRAFDATENCFEALEQLKKCGVKRVLTSGGESNIEKGLKNLEELQIRSEGEIIIMAGGGLNEQVINRLIDIGITEFHGSLITNEHTELPDPIVYEKIKSQI